MKMLFLTAAALNIILLPLFADDPPAIEAVPPQAPTDPVVPVAEVPTPFEAAATDAAAATDESAEPTDNPFDMTLKDGRVLKNYQIHNWNKTTLTIFHNTGAASVPAHLLPDNVAKAYNMDTALSQQKIEDNRNKQLKAAQESLAANEQRRAFSKAPQVKIEGQVQSVYGDGFVIEVTDPKELAGSGYQRVGGIIVGKNGKPVRQYAGQIFGTLWITSHPQAETLVDGDRLRFQARLIGRHQVEGKTYRSVRYEKPLQ